MDIVNKTILENQVIIMRELHRQTGDPELRRELWGRILFTESVIRNFN